MKTLGFIGMGNMGQAMLSGMLESGKVTVEDVIVSAKTQATKQKLEKEYGVVIAEHNIEVVKQAQYVILAVKPQYYETVLNEVRSAITEQTILISIAPGKTFFPFA